MMRVRAMLASVAVVGGLLCGCGPGAVSSGPGSISAANPRLQTSGLPRVTPRSAADAAHAIAARWAADGGPAPTRGTPIQSRTDDFTASVFNPGTSDGFTAFITTRDTVLVTPSSAATIEASNGAQPRFATPADRALWQAAGRPSLGQVPATGQTQAFPPGGYSFLPQGSTLTYQQAASLPSDPRRLAATILDHLRPYAGPHPPASLELKQLAYLIATAPLTDGARSAAWQAVASLPGLRVCQAPSGSAPPRSMELCIDSADDETLVSVGLDTGAVLSIADRLLRPSPMYPHVSTGSVVESSTFAG